MRLAIISDIHSNLEALTEVLNCIATLHIDEIICLGDVVGYGANPNECVSLIKDAVPYVLLGNHDQAALDLERTTQFNPLARMAAEWTNKNLSAESREFLSRAQYSIERHDLLFVHSSPYQPEEWHYIISPADAQFNFSYFPQSICFIGHSHTPVIFCEDIYTREVVPGKKFIVNVGSVGQPRDYDPRASFGVMDTGKWHYENVRVEYDTKRAADKIRKIGLPKALADRLTVGS